MRLGRDLPRSTLAMPAKRGPVEIVQLAHAGRQSVEGGAEHAAIEWQAHGILL